MAEAYDYAKRTLAEQLYVFRGQTYEQVSQELGVSKNQLMRWGKAGEWRAKRKKYLESNAQSVTRLISIRDSILDQLENEIQANTVHQLLSGLRQADSIIEKKLSPGGGADIDRPAIFLEDLRFVVETLARIDPKGVKVIADNYDTLIEDFKERHAQAS